MQSFKHLIETNIGLTLLLKSLNDFLQLKSFLFGLDILILKPLSALK